MSPTYAACCCVTDEDCLDPCDCDLAAYDEELNLYFNFSGKEETISTLTENRTLCPNEPGGSQNECFATETSTYKDTCDAFITATIDLSNINSGTCESIPTIINEYAGVVTNEFRNDLSESSGGCRFSDCYEYFESCDETTEETQSFDLRYATPYVFATLLKYNCAGPGFPTSTACACVESPIEEDQCFLKVVGGFTISGQQLEEYGGNRIRRVSATPGCNLEDTEIPLEECEPIIDSEVVPMQGYNLFPNSYSPNMFEVLYAVERGGNGKCIFSKFAERIGKQRVTLGPQGFNICPYQVTAGNVDLNDPNQTTKTFCNFSNQTEITGVNTLGDCGMLNRVTWSGDREVYNLPCGPFGQGTNIVRTQFFRQELRQNGTVGVG